MATENQQKHLEFTLALSKRLFFLLHLKTFAQALLSTYWLLRTRKHKANRYFRARNMLPRNNDDITHCKEERRINIYLQPYRNSLTLGTRLKKLGGLSDFNASAQSGEAAKTNGETSPRLFCGSGAPYRFFSLLIVAYPTGSLSRYDFVPQMVKMQETIKKTIYLNHGERCEVNKLTLVFYTTVVLLRI